MRSAVVEVDSSGRVSESSLLGPTRPRRDYPGPSKTRKHQIVCSGSGARYLTGGSHLSRLSSDGCGPVVLRSGIPGEFLDGPFLYVSFWCLDYYLQTGQRHADQGLISGPTKPLLANPCFGAVKSTLPGRKIDPTGPGEGSLILNVDLPGCA